MNQNNDHSLPFSSAAPARYFAKVLKFEGKAGAPQSRLGASGSWTEPSQSLPAPDLHPECAGDRVGHRDTEGGAGTSSSSEWAHPCPWGQPEPGALCPCACRALPEEIKRLLNLENHILCE